MPESGDQPYKSRNNGSSGASKLPKLGAQSRESLQNSWRGGSDRSRPADSRISGDAASGQDSISLWQRLFGRNSSRASRRATLRQTSASGLSGGVSPRAGSDGGRASRNNVQSSQGDRELRTDSTGKRSHSSQNGQNGAQQSSFGQFRSGSIHPLQQEGSQSSRNGNRAESLGRKVGKLEQLGETRNGNGYRTRDSRSLSPKEPNQRSFKVLPLAQAGMQERPSPAGRRDLQRQPEPVMPVVKSGITGSRNLAETSKGRSAGRSRRRDGAPARRRSRSFSFVLHATRLLILSVGVGVLAGTILSVWDPANRSLTSQQPVKQAGIASGTNQGQATGAATVSQMTQSGQEMTTLKSAMQALITKNTQMAPGVFVMDLATNAYVDLNGEATFPSASMIKVPILIAFFQDVDAGKIRLDESLVVRKELVGTGSGEMQYAEPGTKYSALDVATKMIIISDNTATNMLIARLGGIRALNQRFKSWGLRTTVINNLLPDLEGTNTTSPKELAFLLERISQGDLVSMQSRDRILDIMRRTENASQLRQGLGAGATIAHKTGDIGSLIGDTGLVDLPNGKRYIITVMVKRAFNDDRAYDFVSQLSRLTYLYFSRSTEPQKIASPAASPVAPSRQVTPSPSNETENNVDRSPENPEEEQDRSNEVGSAIL